MLSPYAFHQFWLNVEDAKVGELLRVFTFLDREQIEDLERQGAEEPWLRAGQRMLADHVTTLVHGAHETEQAKAAATALFGGGDLHGLAPTTLAAALQEAGSTTVERGADVVAILLASGLVSSKSEARRTLAEGGAYLNNQRVTDGEHVPGPDDLLSDGWLVVRRGKKRFAGVRMTP